MEEQAMTAQPVAQTSKRRVGAAVLPGDLAEAETRDKAMEDGIEEIESFEPVGGGKVCELKSR